MLRVRAIGKYQQWEREAALFSVSLGKGREYFLVVPRSRNIFCRRPCH